MRAADVLRGGPPRDFGVARDGAAEEVLDEEHRRTRITTTFWWKSPDGRGGMWVHAACPGCGCWILFGSLATDEERAAPRCGAFPFARRAAA